MAVWNLLPLAGQLATLAVLGAFVGGQVNRGIYRLAWFPRAISPWTPRSPGQSPLPAWARLPIVGWWAVRGESAEYGRAHWIRPVLIECALVIIYPLLYYWVTSGGLLPQGIPFLMPALATFQSQFLLHAVLLPLLLVAMFIDFDEQTIPDAITVTGALLGLILAATIPAGELPVVLHGPANMVREVVTLNVTSPAPWDAWLDGPQGLGIALACFASWCLAIAPWLWTTRRGWRKAVVYLVASLLRGGWIRPLLLVVVGSLAIGGCWWLGGWHWKSLLSALVGLAFGGGLVWLVRIFASTALGEEAMGFGDVTLMAMIGAFLGWQPSLLVFALAPAAAVFISVAQWLLTGRRDIAFGPYLCVATVAVVLQWGPLWHGWGAGFFSLGLLVPAVLLFCLVAMGILLSIWGWLKRRLSAD